MDETLLGTNIPYQSGPGSHGNEEDTLYSPEFQNWSLTTRMSWVSCQEHHSVLTNGMEEEMYLFMGDR